MTAVRLKAWPTGHLGRFSGSEWQSDPAERATAVIAQISAVAVGFDLFVAKGLNLSVVIAAVCLPLWIRVLRAYPLAAWIVGLTPFALAWGWVLSLGSSFDHDIDTELALVYVGVVSAGLAGFVLILWAREFVPLAQVALLFGVGQIAADFVFGRLDWKFDLSFPMAFVVLGIVERSRSRVLPAVAIAGLGVVGVLNGGRSYLAFCLIAAIVTVWQIPRRSAEGRGRTRRWAPMALLVCLGLAMYFTLSSLLAGGFFGPSLQERSSAQIDATGSLIAGGRPEWAATRELMRMTPEGYGLGVVPSWTDLEAGTSGLASINIDAGGYANNYMFGGAFELHSIVSSLWVNCGFMGVALAALVLFTLVRNLSYLLAARKAPTIVIFSTCVAVWSLLFGPLFTDWLPVMVALGLSMLTRDQLGPREAADERPR